ncbi:cytochrome P450 [Cylindrobasidium torrendii FP15055 ss-10]|uniref:Cytochrome P450 n=1 Tax=Cylindrobasidium torrendii FP15055 ss-10 TaxID=1314674 RepID=A0A0D7BL16_9AGAR|nr:cytochrome P450 [Cylindrobasidium torrendii FP15055 ss-10]
MPTGKNWEAYGRMGERYGPLISVSIGPVTMVVANTYAIAHDVLNKKSHIYSDRPHISLAEMVGWDLTTGLLAYGPQLKRTRQMFHSELGTRALVESFHGQIQSQARTFLTLLRDEPGKLKEHCYYHAGAFILRITYGYTASVSHDRFLTKSENAMVELNEALAPGRYLVNILPFLRYLPDWAPGTAFKQDVKIYRRNLLDLLNSPLKWVQENMKLDEAEESFTSKWLKRGLTNEDTDLVMYGAGTLLGAGPETTAITLDCFFLMMILHPDVQAKAQAEIDTVCGRHRLPTFEDRVRLPYLAAVMKEVQRMHPPVPLGLPHSTTQDDIHNGYFVPKGSLIFANVWNMSRDRSVYPDPFKFDPERFLGPEPQQDPADYVFGFGRRVCPGKLVADASLFITVAMSLHAYTFRPPLREDGQFDVPNFEPCEGLTSHLKPYNFDIVPRYSQGAFDELLNGKSVRGL